VFTVGIQEKGLSETARAVMQLPGLFARARKSALGSTGYWIQQELRNQIEYGGSGWPSLHPITLKLRKFRTPANSPLFYMGRFSRYLIDQEGTTVEIGLGRSRKGEPGQTDDPWLSAALRRAEEGDRIPVTKKVRLAWIRTKIKGQKWKKMSRSGAVTGGYFVLRPETQFLNIPKRPVIGPVFRKVQPKITPHFEQKFWAALERYRTGAAKK
jgi:hypothetical protein